MKELPNIIIVAKNQFGYHTGIFKMCEHLRSYYNITYYCFDFGAKKHSLKGVEVVYQSNSGSFINRIINYFQGLASLGDKQWDVMFVMDFDLCFLARFLVNAKVKILDIRSAGISHNRMKRFYTDFRITWNRMFYPQVSVISEGVAKHLWIKNYLLLPLGAEKISTIKKDYSSLKLMYIGTLTGRNIEITVKGLEIFNNKYPDVSISYDIIGRGDENSLSKLKNTIEECRLRSRVHFHGFLNHTEAKGYFDTCNVGVSYVPITSYYDHQPPTKTFEYILSGLVCLGTNTIENRKYISDDNGVLCHDTAESFAKGIETIWENNESFKFSKIVNSLEDYTWNKISMEILKPYIDEQL